MTTCENPRTRHDEKCTSVLINSIFRRHGHYLIKKKKIKNILKNIKLQWSSGVRSESELFTGYTRQDNNHSTGPGPGRLVPSSHHRSELSNTILFTFSRGDKRVWKCIPIPNGLGEKIHL